MAFYIDEGDLVYNLIRKNKTTQVVNDDTISIKIAPKTGNITFTVNEHSCDFGQVKPQVWEQMKADYKADIHLTPMSDYCTLIRTLVQAMVTYCRNTGIAECKGFLSHF